MKQWNSAQKKRMLKLYEVLAVSYTTELQGMEISIIVICSGGTLNSSGDSGKSVR
jgi:hypothetical protein